MPLIKLCELEEISDGDSREFVITESNPERNVFIVSNDDHIVAYENICPHIHAPLNWMPDEFLSMDKDYIQCVNHGALFEIDTGHCVYGPCSGQALQKISLIIENGNIYADL